jgi:acyl-coenzyme A thioesterase PaaI-like protein
MVRQKFECSRRSNIDPRPVFGRRQQSTERVPKATVYQNNHFLRPATGDLRIAATVSKFGKTTAYAEVSVTLAEGGELVARAATEWAF